MGKTRIQPIDAGPVRAAAAALAGWDPATCNVLVMLERPAHGQMWAAFTTTDPAEVRGMLYRLAEQLPEVRRSHG